ncbi:MAG: hypothetical protein IPL43_00755 [Micropruina sp.]|nr:hypothetical protein [Micropruina sp.]
MTEPLNLGPLTADALADDPRLAGVAAPSTHPVALLPVRLETRYATASDGTGELRVRIYPDQVHVDAHDPRLSAVEAAAGQEFWRAQWRTGANKARQQRAWAALAERFDPGRAAWIARVTRPTNPADRPNVQVGDTDALATEPVPPPFDLTEDRRTPLARLLPDRWTATAYSDGAIAAVATGNPITIAPAVGPDLASPLVAAEDDEVAAIDQGMNWLVDFEAAEELGMALRLPISGPVDLLLVTGVRHGQADQGAAELSELLDAQRYTEGLAFLEPGNVDQQRRGPCLWVVQRRPGAWVDGPPPLAPQAAGGVAVRALGVRNDGLFGALPGSAAEDASLAEAISTVLWPSTWGYWLAQFAGVALADSDWARDHARQFVRPGGPLPALRVGRQPYGLLPVTSLGRFAGDARENRLRRILVGLLEDAWRPVIGRAPRVGRGDVAADLVDVLRLEGRSDDLRLRRQFGSRFADNAERFLGRRLGDAGFWDAARDRALPIAAAAGVGLISAALAVHEPQSHPVTLPLIGDTEAEQLTALLTADLDALARDTDAAAGSLLTALARHGLLREHATAAARLLGGSAADEEFYGFGDSAPGWAAQRATRLPEGDTVAERIAAGTDPATAGLAGFTAALGVLSGAAVAALERHLMGTVDAAGHRLDAWVTSLASRRLAELRATQPAGLLVGGYGWVEQLAPATSAQLGAVPGEPGPLLAPAQDVGFLHAPSIHQAQVAALMRNAHLANGGGKQDPFAITLTSERVRLARTIFDGVRAGRSLGAVLGYLVERDLHERELDAAVDNAREVAPLPGQEDLPIAARRLDGLKLHQLWADSEDHALDHLLGSNPSARDRKRAIAVLRRLNAAVDAAADALQAEQVHQFARGDLTRAVSSVADIDRGLAPPPELDFVHTPRSGIGVTHRVALLLDPDAPTAPGWAGPADSPLAAAEPGLDAWLGRMLPTATGLSLTLRDGASGTPVALPELRLSASDAVRIAGAGEAGLAELAARAALVAGADLARPVLASDSGLLDLLEVGRSLSALIASAKPLDGTSLQVPHADPLPGLDGAELERRLSGARAALERVVAGLNTVLTMEAPSLEQLRSAVAASWSFGVGEAGLPTEQSVSTWTGAAARVAAQLLGRLAEADAVTGGAPWCRGRN